MGDWRNNPVNSGGTLDTTLWDSPTIQDQLVRQELISKGVPANMIEGIMRQVAQAKGLKDKQSLGSDLSAIMNPIGPEDTLQAQENMAFDPSIPDPSMPAQVSDQAAGDVSPSSTDPAATPEAEQMGLLERLGPEGFEILLNQGGIDEQRDQAMYLRNKEGPQGLSGVGRMNTFVAANPLAHLASGVEKHRAKKDIKRLRDEEKEGNRTMLELLRNADKKIGSAEDEDPDVGFGIGGI